MSSIKQIPIGEIALTTGTTVNVSSGDVTAAPFMIADIPSVYRVTGSETLSVADFVITISAASGPTKNTKVDILWEAVCVPASNDVIIAGATIPQSIVGGNFKAECTYNGSSWTVMIFPDWEVASIVGPDRLATDSVETAKVKDDAITTVKVIDDAITIAKMAGLAKGSVIIGDASGDPSAVSLASDAKLLIGDTALGYQVAVMSGDASMSKSGAVSIANSAIDTIKLDASLKEEIIVVPVSFETGEQGDNKIKMPYGGTVNHIYAIATKAIAGTDDATIVLKDNAGTTMTDGTITFSASDAIGTAYTDDPSANNTFADTEVIYLTTSKVTAGGKALVSIHITRS